MFFSGGFFNKVLTVFICFLWRFFGYLYKKLKTVRVMMTLNEIKENLCYNDLRNPNATIDEETAKEIAENNADCYCDNCFRGKTILAEELLKYYKIVNQ